MTEQETINSFPARFCLKRSRRRSLALTIAPDATLTIRAPWWVSMGEIERFTRRHFDWIEKRLTVLKSRPLAPVHRYVAGEEFWYLGEKYKLFFGATGRSAQCNPLKKELLLPEGGPRLTKKKIIAWYKKEARRIIGARLDQLAALYAYRYRSWRLTSAGTRWGSCSSSGNLNFTWRLVMLPPALIDYVINHELAHLRHPNHSRTFWQEVARLDPDYLSRRKWLKKNSGGYYL